MRVLHVLRFLEVGGTELTALQLAGWLSSQGAEVTVSALPGPLSSCVPQGVTLHERQTTSFSGLVRSVYTDTLRGRVDVLHAHQRREALACFVVGRALGRTVVEHAQNVIPSRRGRAFSYRSDRIFAVARPVADMVVNEFRRPEARVQIVRNIPISIRPPVAASPASSPPQRTARSDRPRIVAVGRVDVQKDPGRFIRVVQELERHGPVAALWYGDGPLLREMRGRSRGTPCEFVGGGHDIATALASADALVMTSAWEGAPLVALEALTAGIPVIATDVGGVRDLLEPDRCGTVVPATASDSDFAQEIRDALEPGGERCGRVERGRALIARSHTPDAAFTPILHAYRSLIQERARSGRLRPSHGRGPA